MRPLLLISAEVPHQCIIRAKHLRSLGFKALVPTATISQLFTAIVFANIPHTCGFYTAFPIDLYSQQSLLPTVSRILLSDLSLHASPCLCLISVTPERFCAVVELSCQPASSPHTLHLLSHLKVCDRNPLHRLSALQMHFDTQPFPSKKI